MWSKVRFSPMITMTCLIGEAVGRLAAASFTVLSSARTFCTRGPKIICVVAIKATTTRAFCRKVPADVFKGFIEVPRRLKNHDPKGLVELLGCLSIDERAG